MSGRADGRGSPPRGTGDEQDIDELMGELRVALPGAQVLFAFLLTVPFSARFADLPDLDRGVFFVALVAAALASVLLIAPTGLRQILRHSDGTVLRVSARLALAGLAALGTALVAVMYVVTDVILGATVAAVTAAGLASVVIALWWVLPLTRRANGDRGEGG